MLGLEKQILKFFLFRKILIKHLVIKIRQSFLVLTVNKFIGLSSLVQNYALSVQGFNITNLIGSQEVTH